MRGSWMQSLVRSKSSRTKLYELRLAVSITLDHTNRRHSSLRNSPSDNPVGHIIVPIQPGAMPSTDGQWWLIVNFAQLHEPEDGAVDGPRLMWSGVIGSFKGSGAGRYAVFGAGEVPRPEKGGKASRGVNALSMEGPGGTLANPFIAGTLRARSVACAWTRSASRVVMLNTRKRESRRRSDERPRSSECSGCDCISKYAIS